jgi:hypothetical protein
MIILGDPDGVFEDLMHVNFRLKVVSNPGMEPDQYLGAMIGKYQFVKGLCRHGTCLLMTL